ncbi:MAG TPA: phosphatase PAP2 family protein [Alphaproteobacteria bacterium]|nr:phosphatase PAP2 family protein [Alphaproteobacteria bacterium]
MTYTKLQWLIIALFLIIEIIWVRYSSFLVIYNKTAILFFTIPLCVVGVLYVIYKKFRPDVKIVSLLIPTSILLAYAPLMLLFSYLGATLNLPFVDSSLVSIDSFFGVHSPSVVFWFQNHKWWNYIFIFFYDTYVYQFPFIILYFGLRGETIILQRFFMQFIIATPLSVIVSIIFPAAGASVWYGYTPNHELSNALNHLLQLRQNVLDVTSIDGIVTLPSFHCVMAFIYAYTFRNEKKILFIPILIINLLMIFSCIPIGGHYFVDILAAIPIFLLAVGIESLIFKSMNGSKLTKDSER